MEIIIPPPGMRPDLARKLVHEPTFAHMWLCHDVEGCCQDGCDTHPDPQRAYLYSQIEVETHPDGPSLSDILRLG